MPPYKKILVLGGSNAGLYFGWAAQLKNLLPKIDFENAFLGGSGSLYGLLYLLKLVERNEQPPDLILFEYTLNDIVFLEACQLEKELLIATLREILSICASLQIRILFLGLTPKPKGYIFHTNHPVRVVKKLYYRSLKREHQENFIDLNATLNLDYLDDHHLTEASSISVGQYLAQHLTKKEIKTLPKTFICPPNFKFLEPFEATLLESCELKEVSTPVYTGEFLEIMRGGRARYTQRGRLAGLLIRATEKTGIYTLSTQALSLKKSAQSTMREIVPNLILMHNIATPLFSDDEIEIALPKTEKELIFLPEDRSLLVCASPTAFEEQSLEIGALLFWITTSHPLDRSFIDRLKSQFLSLFGNHSIRRTLQLTSQREI